MAYTFKDKSEIIIERCLKIGSTDVYEIFKELAALPCVGMHGPEHHVIDGACILTAYRNAGGSLDLQAALEQLADHAAKMPGAMCGQWGVCGAVTSAGAVIAIIEKTGPLSSDDWGSHMKLTSRIIGEMGSVGGPRCCKRDGFITLKNAVEYINEYHNMQIGWTEPACSWHHMNGQCIGAKCPFYKD